jgi:cardiolipin synthase
VECLVQPDDGVAPLIKAINKARKSIEILIFRFNRRDLERALADAVQRGVRVHALIANTNRGGEKNLRALELRLLAAGITVSRTDGAMARYHAKFIIIDRRELYLLAFNFTYEDIDRSRSFGVVTRKRPHVREAINLFEADALRQPYVGGSSSFVVSPVNSRKILSSFIRGAKRELLIYDPAVSDPAMVRLLASRSKAGVRVKILGRLEGSETGFGVRALTRIRLHNRAMIRDGQRAFVGSQSLKARELDSRREAGIIVGDQKIVNRLAAVFEADWESNTSDSAKDLKQEKAAPAPPVAKIAKAVAESVASDLSPITPLVETTLKDVVGEETNVDLDPAEIESSVKTAIRDAVKNTVKSFVQEAADVQSGGGQK